MQVENQCGKFHYGVSNVEVLDHSGKTGNGLSSPITSVLLRIPDRFARPGFMPEKSKV